ncbi:MAG: Hsp33 family molecular chaperone HslO [Pseudomonadota bacterium]
MSDSEPRKAAGAVAGADRLRRFLFEDAPVRGHWVRLSRTWMDAREHQVLPLPVMQLLGESLAAISLIAASLKFTGTLTLQLSGGTGPVTMLVAQATDVGTLRGVAHAAASDASVADFQQLVGGGRLVVSMEQGDGMIPWQGVVPLLGNSLAQSLENYFAASEQVPTAIVLAADATHAAGLLLQKLPGSLGEGEAAGIQDVWEEATALLATLRADELLAWDVEELLHKLFGGRDLRLFDAEPVRFACRCSRERVATMLAGVGKSEVDSIVAEQGAVTVTCEFCCKPYRFDAVDAAQLFIAAGAGAPTDLN